MPERRLGEGWGGVEVLKLRNGATLILDRHGSPLFSIVVGVGVGSLYEERGASGVTHLLEHMLFNIPGFDVDAAVEALGGESNAFTSRDYLALVVESVASSAVDAVKLAYRVYSNSVFEKERLEKEKLVVMSELRLSREDPSERVGELALMALFGESDWGRPVGGVPAEVASIDLETLTRHKETWFVPENTVVALSGGFGEEAVKTAAELFGSLEGPPPPRKTPSKARGPGRIVERREVDGAYYAYAAEVAVDTAASTFAALSAASFALGDGTKSVLFNILRSRGLSYSYYVDYDVVGDTGYILVAVESSSDLEAVRSAVEEALKPRRPPSFRLAYFNYLWSRRPPSARAMDYVEFFIKGGRPQELDSEIAKWVEAGTEPLRGRIAASAEAVVAP